MRVLDKERFVTTSQATYGVRNANQNSDLVTERKASGNRVPNSQLGGILPSAGIRARNKVPRVDNSNKPDYIRAYERQKQSDLKKLAEQNRQADSQKRSRGALESLSRLLSHRRDEEVGDGLVIRTLINHEHSLDRHTRHLKKEEVSHQTRALQSQSDQRKRVLQACESGFVDKLSCDPFLQVH
jgi:hypothetical protein